MQNRPLSELEGYDDVINKLIESLPVERRLVGLTPEERLKVGVLALPNDALRALSPDYVATLPGEVQEAIRKRLG